MMPKFDWSNLGPFVQAVKTACGAGALAMGVHVVDDVKKSFGILHLIPPLKPKITLINDWNKTSSWA